jgi:glycopeptide antibiotics resistance protein
MNTTTRWLDSLGPADLLLAVLLVLAAVIGLRSFARGEPDRWRRLLVGLFVIYLVAVVMLEFCPLPSLTPPHAAFAGTPPPGWLDRPPPSPSISLRVYLPGDALGSESQDLMNVLLTVPLGLALRATTRWRPLVLVATVLVVPLAIETMQFLISEAVGYDWRAFDAQDLTTKALGGLLGLSLYAASALLAHHLRRRLGTAQQAEVTAVS